MEKHINGTLESAKFKSRREDFYEYRGFLENQEISISDFLEHFTAYVGHMSLNRVLTLYELYKMTKDVAGHIAEIGVYKGAGTILFAKLVRIFESESLTQIHGFDWFQGTGKGGENDSELVPEGGYQSDYNFLMDLISKQKLEHIIRIHNFDVTKELSQFFEQYKHLQFKMVFMDAGMYEVMQACIPLFWERLTPGGIMVFDQFNHELGPGETLSVRELLPNAKVKTIPNSWMPNAYIIKE
ncbi:MAG: class I SAM-dependent methyltransferase [gamma proteobacterium symbiont of Taylorina sp.]|nr:class I SAM-dependent methyltransferase [gamma proteobacterium symbiont of Taylorina sp.]